MAADGLIVLGLDVSQTQAEIQAGLDSILNKTKTKEIILKTAIEKAETEKKIDSVVKSLNKKTVKMGVEVDARSVNNILAAQQKIASTQAKLNAQMKEYRDTASKIGLTLNKDSWNPFSRAVKDGDFAKANEILKSTKKQIEAYNAAVQKMNSDTSVSGSVSSIVEQFSKLKDVSTETQKRVNLLKANLAQFENADNTQKKLSAYKRLQTMIESLSDELRTLSSTEKSQSSDLSIKKKIDDARSSLEVFKTQYEGIGNSAAAQKVTAAITALDTALKGVDSSASGGALAKQWDKVSAAIDNAKRAVAEYNAASKSKKTTSGILEDIKNAETYVKNLNTAYASIGDSAGAEKLKKAISELQTALDNIDKSATGNKLSAQWDSVATKIAEAKRAVAEYNAEQSAIGSLGERFDDITDKIQTALSNIGDSGIKGTGVDQLTTDLTKLQEKAKLVQKDLGDLDPNNAEDVKRLSTAIEELETDFSKLKDNASSFKDPISAQQLATNIEKAKQKVAEYAETYSAIKSRPDLVKELNELQKRAEDLSTKTDLKKFNADFEQFNTKVKQAGLHTKSLGDRLKDAFKNFASFFSASRVIYEVISKLGEMVQNVKNLDAAMVNLRKVTDETDASYDRFLTRATAKAKELGTTVVDLVDATTNFSRLGFSLSEAEELGQLATIYANVGDLSSIDDATNSIISTMKGFGIEAENASSILDKFNEVGNNFAISSGDIGEALQRSASSMAAANNTIDETIALITAANTVVQDATSVGNAFKTISMRIRGATTEMEQAGLDMEGMASSTAKLREEIMALSGVDIMIDDNTFKSTYQIIEELAAKWGELSDIQQASITELIAGKRQGNIISAVMENFDIAQEALNSSLESSGSAMEEYNTYLEGIEAKTNQFKAAFEALSLTVINSDFLKWIIESGTDVITVLDNIIDAFDGVGNALLNIISIIALFNPAKTLTLLKMIFATIAKFTGITKLTSGIKALTSGWKAAKSAGLSFGQFLGNLKSQLLGAASTATIATAAIAGIVATITIAVAAYQNFKQKIEEQRQAAEEAATAYQEQSASVDEYKNTIRSLRDELDNGNLSEQEAYEKRQQLLQIEQELIDLFGDEAEGINLVTGSIESQISAIDKLSEAQWKAYKQENIDAIQRAVDSFTNLSDTSPITLPDLASLQRGIANLDLDIVPKDFLDEFQKRIKSSLQDFDFLKTSSNFMIFDTEGKSIYEILDAYQQAYDITEKMGKEYFGENYLDYLEPTLSNYSSLINEIKTTLDENETIFNTYVEGLLNYDQTYSEVWGKVLSAQKEYNDAVLNGDDEAATAAFQKMKDAQQAFLDAGWDNDAVNLYMQDFFDKWNADAKNHELQLEIKTKLADDKDSLGNMVKQAAKYFEDEAGKVDLYAVLNAGVEYEKSPRKNNRHASLTEEEQAYVQLKYAAEQYGMTVEELITLLGQLGYITLSGTENVVETTKKAQKSYESLKTSVENVVDSQMAMKSVFADNTHLTEDTYNAIVALVGGEDKLADCIDTTNGYLVTNADALRKVVNAAEEATLSDLKMAEAHEKLNYHELVGQLYDVTDGLESYDEATLNSIGTILDQIDATKLQIAQYKLLEQQLLGVTNAFTELENAQAIDSAADYTDDLVSMIQTLIGSYENKEFGTEAFWTGLKSLVPEDIYGQFEDAGDQIEAGWEYLNDKLARYFTYDEGNVSIDSSNIEKFVSDALSTQLGDSTVFTGSLEHFELNPQIQSLEDLADAMGITTTAAFALASGISKYSANNADFLSSLTSDGTTIENLDNNIYQCDQTMQELLERRAQLAQAGEINTDEWDEVQDKISETKEQYESFRAEARKQIQASIQIDSQVTEQQELVDGLKTDLDNFDGTNAEYQVLLSNYTEEQQKLAELLQQKYQLGEPTEVTIQVALEQVQSEIDNTKAEIAKIADYDGETYTIKAGADQSDLDALLEKLDGLESEAAEIKVYAGLDDTDVLNSLESIQNYVIDDKNFKVEMNDGTTLSRLQQIKSTLTGIKDKTIHVRTYQTTYTSAVSGGRGGTSRATGSAHERGNWGIPRDEHDALVGELGEELVVDPRTGTYKTVGENGAELIDLPKGAIVFNHQQTKELLKNKKIHTRGEAYAEGNAHAGFGFVGRDYSFGESSKPSGSSGSVNANVTVSVDNKALEESLKDTLDENSDYIQNLQKQWWDYHDAIVEVITSMYEEIISGHENQIELTEHWLEQAIASADAMDIARYTGDIVQHYRDMQEAVHEQAEYYRSLGYAETSDEISQLTSLWWEYYDKIKTVSADAWEQVVDNANDALDNIQGMYDSLKNAAQEYAEYGYITVDSLQDILSYGVEYLAFLQDENGQLVINEANIQKVIAARTQQMAIESALNYIQQLRTALTNNDTVALLNLTNATNIATASTWDLVYAQLQLLGLSDEQYNNALQRINAMRSLTDMAVTSIGRVDTSAKEALEETSTALEDLLKYVEEMIKQEVENQISALEDQIDKYREIVDLQKESLDLEREKDKYTKDVTEKTKSIAELQARIAMLDLDDSREAQAEKRKLQEQLAEEQSDLAETQADHAYEATSDMLDNMADAYEKEKQKEIEILEDSISSAEKIYQLAIDRINNHWDTLYDDLINWNYQYGNTVQSELISAWNAASGAVQQYGSYLNAVAATQAQIAAFDASSGFTTVGTTGDYDTSGGQTMSRIKEIVAQMKANSQAHHNASTEEKARLNQANLDLGKELQKLIGRTVVRGDDYVWYLDKVGGAQLYSTYPYSTYHTGGIVGDDATPKQDEMFALLKKREAVFTEPQQEVVYRILKADETIAGKLGISGGLYHSMNGSGYAEMQSHNAVMRDMQQAQAASGGNHVSQSIGDVTVPVHVMVTEKLDKSDIQRLSREIGNIAGEEIAGSFIRAGKGTLRGSRLRP